MARQATTTKTQLRFICPAARRLSVSVAAVNDGAPLAYGATVAVEAKLAADLLATGEWEPVAPVKETKDDE